MSKATIRYTAAALSIGRALFGAAMIAVPTRVGEAWIGEPGRYERVSVLTRSMGARDIGLGAGAAVALFDENDDAAVLLLAGQALADVVDFAGTLAVRDRIPPSGLKITLGLAGLSGLAAGAAAAALRS